MKDIRCQDCGRKADSMGFVPIDQYLIGTDIVLLCLGDLATRRIHGMTVKRVLSHVRATV